MHITDGFGRHCLFYIHKPNDELSLKEYRNDRDRNQ
ncbi:Uncharacterised protein [Vibrio cholerae]|nr:Uncharacterised protein [Vibrio cholerae]